MYLRPEKDTPFRAEPPRIGYHREYPPGMMEGAVTSFSPVVFEATEISSSSSGTKIITMPLFSNHFAASLQVPN